MNKCYSTDGEEYQLDFPDHLELGDTYYEADCIHETNTNYITQSSIKAFLEELDCNMADNHGEYFVSCFTDANDEEVEELRQLVLFWANKNVRHNVYHVANSVEKIATEDDV